MSAPLRRPAAALAFASLLAACTDGAQSPTEPEVTDVGGYLASLPTWAEYSPPLVEEDVVESSPGLFEQQGNLVCTERQASLTRNPQDLVMFSPDAEVMWLGSLLQGRGHRDGLGSLLELPIRQRAPLVIGIDILFSDNRREVGGPDVTSVGQAIGELIDGAQAAGHRSGSSIYFSQVESHSFDQGVLALGLSKTKLGRTVRFSLSTEKTDSSSTVMASFTQKMFTTSVVLPQSPSEFFSNDFTERRLQEQIDRGNVGPENLPVYVSSIAWGRMLLVEITGNHSVLDLKAALGYAAAGDTVSRNDSLSVKYRRVLSDSEMKVVAIGGHAQAAIDLIRTGRLGAYFEEDAPLTSARPISYVLRNLGDNTIARVSETTSYTIRECQPNAVAQFTHDRSGWLQALSDQGLTSVEYLTTADNIARSVEWTTPPGLDQEMGSRLTFLSTATDLPFDFYLENRSAVGIPEARYVREGLVYRDQELPRHDGLNDRWISIGDTDGVGGNYDDKLQDDDFDIVIERFESPVFAIGVDVGDNSSTGGESITITGRQSDGTDFRFKFTSGIPSEGFVGFIAPFPIRGLFFDEDPGGDDIAIRDFRFGIR